MNNQNMKIFLCCRYRYDHEYLGPKLSMIHTPLTDRAHHSLVMAMKEYKVGTLIGPSCTGKTDTVLSLSQVSVLILLC